MNPSYMSFAGLVIDVIGAIFLAIDFLRPFSGTTTIDVGDAGAINGGTRLIVNRAAIAHANLNRKFILAGLVLLAFGFMLQAAGTLMSSGKSSPSEVEVLGCPSVMPPNHSLKADGADAPPP